MISRDAAKTVIARQLEISEVEESLTMALEEEVVRLHSSLRQFISSNNLHEAAIVEGKLQASERFLKLLETFSISKS